MFIFLEYGNSGSMDTGGADFDSGECFGVAEREISLARLFEISPYH